MFDSRFRACSAMVAGILAVVAVGLVGSAGARGADAAAPADVQTSVAAVDAAPGGADASSAADTSSAADQSDQSGPGQSGNQNSKLQTVVVTAQRLNVARSGIETQTGASTYTIDSSVIAAAPGGENQSFNQVLLQMPDVVQDSFGQLHVRADHNDLQYRLNGIILPEGISVFSQTFSPRFVSSVSLITGALPAEYGLRTAGIIDITANSGLLNPGGSVSIYGGSQGLLQPAFEYGGSAGTFNYYVMGDYKQTDLGIESPDTSAVPVHDFSKQLHGFGYFEDIVDESNRLALILGIQDGNYQIPNQVGLQPTLGYTVQGVSEFPSENLDESQHELAEYAILAWQHSAGDLDWQTSLSARYTSLNFEPDPVGDLLYNGIAQWAFKDDIALAWQTDVSYKLNSTNTVRTGFYLQHDEATSNTTSSVLPINAAGMQTSDVPLAIPDNNRQVQEIESVYLQDEWRPLAPLTINYGLRFDNYSAFSSGSQLSPRLNFVWQLDTGTTFHGGYSRYFTSPPFELVAATSIEKFIGTSAVPPGTVTLDTAPFAERANYYDLGVQQKLLSNSLTLGVDTYYEQAQHLIDEGQFGAPIILTPFNYRYGLLGGVELTGTYAISNFSTYANLSFQAAHGKEVESAQFNFAQQQLEYIADNYIHLDHEGRVAASGGASYMWQGTRFSADFIFGTGLREDLVLANGYVIPNGAHTPSYTSVNFGVQHAFHIGGSGPLTLQFALINAFDKVYQIRSGTGIGVFAPQYGAPRGVFGGVIWEFGGK